MSTEPSPKSEIAEALLQALQLDAHHEVRARRGRVGHPAYHLHRVAVPAGGLPAHRVRRGQTLASRLDAPLQSADAATETKRCTACGTSNPAASRFCVQCGYDFQKARPEAESTERERAATPYALVAISETGDDGERLNLEWKETVVGRAGDIRFPSDAFLSPKHARLSVDQGKLFIEDLYSLNGTFVKLRDSVRLQPGDTFLMGRQVLRFERFEQEVTAKARSADGTRYMGSPPPGGSFKLLQIGIAGVVQNIYCLPEAGVIIGRERGDIVFRTDQFMSSTHAQIVMEEDGHYYLSDLNSSNGTWVKIWERKALERADFVFMGQQLFRVE